MSERSFEMVEAGSAPGEDGTPRSEAAQRAADMLRSAQAVQDWRSGQIQLQGSVDQPPMAHSPVPSSVDAASASGVSDAILAELFATTPIAAAPSEPLPPLPQLPPIHTGQRSSYAGGSSHTGPQENSPTSGRPSSAPATRRSFLNDDTSRASAHARVRQLAEAVGFDLPSLDIHPLPPRSPLGAPSSRSHPATPRLHQDHDAASLAPAAAGAAAMGDMVAPVDDLGHLGDDTGDVDDDATSPEERVAQLEEERDVLVDKLLDTTEALHDSETRFLAKSAAAEQVHALLVQLQDLLRRAEGERDRAQRQLQAAAAAATNMEPVSQGSVSGSGVPREAVAVQTEAVAELAGAAQSPLQAAGNSSSKGSDGSGSSKGSDGISGTAAPNKTSKKQLPSGPSAGTPASTNSAAPQAKRPAQQPPQQQQQQEEGWPILAAVRSQLCGMALRLRWRDAAVLFSCGALLALLLLTHSATWRAGLQAGAREQRIAELQEQVAALQAQVNAGESAGVQQPQQRPEAAKWHVHHGRMKRHERHMGHQDSSGSRSWSGARDAYKTQDSSDGHSRQALGALGSTASSASSNVHGQCSSNTNGGFNSTGNRAEPTVQSAAAIEAAQKRLEQHILTMQEQLQAWARAHPRSSGPAAGASASDSAATAQPKEQHTHHHTHHHIHNHACELAHDAHESQPQPQPQEQLHQQQQQQQQQMGHEQPCSVLHAANATSTEKSAQRGAPQPAGKQPQQLQEQRQCAPDQQHQGGDSKQQAGTQTDPPAATQLDAAAMHSKAALDAVWAKMKEHAAALHQPDAAHMRVVKALRDEWLAAAKRGAAAAAPAAHQMDINATAGTAAAKAAADAAAAAAVAREAAAWPDSHSQASYQQKASQQGAQGADHQAPAKAYKHQHQHQHQHARAQPAPTPLPPTQPAKAPADHTSSSSTSSWHNSPALISAHQTLLAELSRLATAASMHKRLSSASPITKACSLLSPDQQPKLPWLSARRLRRVEGLLSNVCQGAAPHDKAALASALLALKAPLGELHAAASDKGDVATWRRAVDALHREMTDSDSKLVKALPRIMPGQDVTWRSMRRVLKKAAKSLDLGLAHALQHASRQVWESMQTDGEDGRKLVLRMWDARQKAGLALEQMECALDDVLQAEAAAEVLTAARAKGAAARDGGDAAGVVGGGSSGSSGSGGGGGSVVYTVKLRRMG